MENYGTQQKPLLDFQQGRLQVKQNTQQQPRPKQNETSKLLEDISGAETSQDTRRNSPPFQSSHLGFKISPLQGLKKGQNQQSLPKPLEAQMEPSLVSRAGHKLFQKLGAQQFTQHVQELCNKKLFNQAGQLVGTLDNKEMNRWATENESSVTEVLQLFMASENENARLAVRKLQHVGPRSITATLEEISQSAKKIQTGRGE